MTPIMAADAGAIMAVDLGDARIGVAICAGPGLPAVPIATIAHRSRQKDIVEILALAAVRDVNIIVVGYPLKMDGSVGPAAKKVDVFLDALRAAFFGQVIAHDERLTTAAAARKLRDVEVSGSKKRRYIDQLAAVEILNSYLASQRQP